MYHSPIHYDAVLRTARAVFAGRVVRVAEVHESNAPHALVVAQRVTIRVRKIWSGDVPATVTLINRAARELVLYAVGEDAVFIADPWSSSERELGTSYCFRLIDKQPDFRLYLDGKTSLQVE